MEFKHNRLSSSESDVEYFRSNSEFKPLINETQVKYFHQSNNSSKWLMLTKNIRFKFKNLFASTFKESFMLGSEEMFVLGKRFSCRPALKSVYKEAKKEVKAIIWVSYRSEIGPYGGAGFVSDAGWGCTIRVAQMIFVNALRKWYDLKNDEVHHIVMLVEDNMESAPFSLKNIVEISAKPMGEWFSPCEVSHCLTDLMKNFSIPGLKSIVCMDQLICLDQVLSLAYDIEIEQIRSICCCLKQDFDSNCNDCGKQIKNLEWKNSILLFLPMMLGMRAIQNEYAKVLKYFLKNKFSIGIIGGRPKSALYLVGIKGDNVIYLDPHYVQVSNKSYIEFKRNIGQYYSQDFLTTSWRSLESSMNPGLLFKTFDDFRSWIEDIKTSPDVEGFISIQSVTPDYRLEDFVFEEDEDGFVVL